MTNPIEKKLKAMLFRHLCPTQMELGEYELGVLEAVRYQEIVQHLKQCEHCRRDLVDIRTFLAAPDALVVDTEAPYSFPEQVKRFVVDLFSPPPGTRLTPAVQPAFRGSAGDMQTKVYRVGPYVVAISIQKDATRLDTYDLLGDISSLEEHHVIFDTWQAELWQPDELIAESTLDTDGQFRFSGVQFVDSPYELILSSPDCELHLKNLDKPTFDT